MKNFLPKFFTGLLLALFCAFALQAQINIAVTSQTDVACNGGADGEISILPSGGSGVYGVVWERGGTTVAQNRFSVSGLLAGVYTITVTDLNNPTQTAQQQVTLTEPAQLLNVMVADSASPLCGGQNTGFIQLAVTGGEPAYDIRWNNGQTGATLVNLPPGNYSVVVTDARGCEARENNIRLDAPPALVVSAQVTQTLDCFGDADAQAEVSFSGGTPRNNPSLYDILWSTNATSETITGLAAGVYDVTVTDTNNCQQTASVTVTQPDELRFADVIGNNVSCNGGTDGAITVTMTGGTPRSGNPAYTYEWRNITAGLPGTVINGALANSVQNLAAGNYRLTVTDQNGCAANPVFRDILITEPDPLVIDPNFTQTNVSCNGGADGALGIDVEGGTQPYSVTWNNGDNTENLSGLTAGTYSVTATDANNCQTTETYTITEPTRVRATASVVQQPTCNGDNDGSAQVVAIGGTPPYTYLWSAPVLTRTDATVTGIPAGNYTVNVRDDNNCLVTANVTLGEPAPVVITVNTVRDVRCNGANDGSIGISVSGGTPIPGPNYTYNWSHLNTGNDPQNVINLGPDIYTVTATDANGCTDVESIQIEEPDELVMTVLESRDLVCNGESTGVIEVGIAGGTLPYPSIIWSDGPRNVRRRTNLPAGSYSIEVRDANGCQATASATLDQPALPLSISLNQLTRPTCNGLSNGRVGVDVAGGTIPYDYRWSTGSTAENLTDIPAGTYFLTVTDDNDCETDARFVVTEPDEIDVELLDVRDVLCNGAAEGEADVAVSGGTPNYSFFWSNGFASRDLRNAPAGSYTLTVTDANSCESAPLRVTIEEPAELELRVDGVTQVNCNGAANGAISISVFGGTQPYAYNWTGPNGFFSSEQDLTNLGPGSYTGVVTDLNGCQISATAEITEPTAVELAITDVQDVSCFGGNDGQASVQASGGTGPYTYQWSNGRTGPTAQRLRAIPYIVFARDANGCTSNVVIPQPSQPSAPVQLTFAGSQDVDCFGALTGSARVVATGGVPPYEYQWSNGSTDPQATDLRAGFYNVNVTDANGCRDELLDIEIQQPDAALTIAQSYIDDVSCFGVPTGNIGIDARGGTEPYQYLWSNGRITEDLLNIRGGEYDVTVTDANGCTATRSFTVEEPAAGLDIVLNFVNDARCNGDNTGEIGIDVLGGTPTYSYEWSNGARTQDIAGIPAGEYTVVVTDRNDCSISETYIVGEPSALVLTIDNITTIPCAGGNTGEVDISVQGGVPEYSYVWTSGQTTQDATGLTAGAYQVRVIDDNGCIASEVVEVTEEDVLTVTLSGVRDVSCAEVPDGAVDISVTGGTGFYTYLWGNGRTTQDISGVPVGSYTVAVFDQAGCTVELTAEVDGPEPLVASVGAQNNVTCNGGNDGSIGLNVEGGTPPYTYAWNTGATTQDIPGGLTAGEYGVTVTDANGCTDILDIELTEPTAVEATLSFQDNVRCNGEASGAVGVSVIGGAAPYGFRWSDGGDTQDRSDLAAGVYILTVTDARGCQDILPVVMTQPAPINIVTAQLRNATCQAFSGGAIDIEVTGGTPNYDYLWSNGRRSEDVINLSAGEYSVIVTDANDCFEEKTFTIELLNRTANIINLDPFYCVNGDPATLEAIPAGGTFSGPGVTGATFDPQAAGVGEHEITYEVIIDGCPYVGTATATVAELPEVEELSILAAPADLNFCSSDAFSYRIVSLPNIPFNSTLTVTGAGVTELLPNVYGFRPSDAGSGDHTLTGVVTDETTGCASELTIDVTVNEASILVADVQPGTICPGESATLTALGADSYDWAPSDFLSCAPNCTGIGNSVTASPATSRTYTVTGITNGCRVSQVVQVRVAQPSPIIPSASQTTICEGTSRQLFVSSQSPYEYSWAPTTGLNVATGRFVTAAPDVTTTYTVTGSLPDGGCIQTTEITVNVTPSRVIVQAEDEIICRGSSTVLTAESTEPGNFTFLWAPTTGLSPTTGASVIATPQTTTTYTVFRSGTTNCRTAEVTVEVDQTETGVSGLGSAYCTDAAPVVMTGLPEGGTFSGPGVSGNVFNPSVAGEGVHEIIYSGTSPGGCAYNIVNAVTVGVSADARFLNLENSYCTLQQPFTLVAEPAGGVFSGPGVIGSTFNPASLSGGQITIRYTGTATETGCAFDITRTVTIVAADQEIAGLDDIYCTADGPVVLTGVPAGGTFSGPGISGNTFDPSAAGPGFHQIEYSGVFGPCRYSVEQSVRVVPPPAPFVVPFAPTCQTCANGRILALSSTGSGAYEYSLNGGPFQTASLFANLASGEYTITVRDLNTGCSASATVTLGEGCGVPAIVSVSPGNTQANVTWSSVAGATQYILSWRPANSMQPWVNLNFGAGITSFLITNLSPDTEYEVRVRARCNSGLSNWSPIRAFTTGGQTCAAPTITTITPGVTQATVSWTSTPGATSYIISWREPGFAQTWTNINTPASPTSFQLTNLTPGRQYEVRVRARCASGFSNWSSIRDFTTQSPARLGGEQTEAARLRLYPNPNRGAFAAAFALEQAATVRFALTDLQGRTVWTQTRVLPAGSHEIALDATKLPAGVYLFRLSGGDATGTAKVVVE